MDNRFKDHVFK